MSTIDTGSYHLIWWHHNLNGFREFLSMAEVLSILYKYQNVSNICLLRSRSTRDVKLHGFGRTISLCLLSSLLSTVSAKYTVGKRNFVVLGTTLYFNWCHTFIWFFLKCQSSTVTGLIVTRLLNSRTVSSNSQMFPSFKSYFTREWLKVKQTINNQINFHKGLSFFWHH